MNIDEDTSEWLGCPTPLEMYQHQCAMLEDELIETQRRLNEARRNITGLVSLSDQLATGKAKAEADLEKALAEVARLNWENSGMDTKIQSLMAVVSQRDLLFRENQRLALELNVLRGPEP